MNKVKGELITANLYRLQKGMKECQLENWYDPEYKPIKITLDELLSPQKNAERYFKIYNKQKRAKEILTPMLEKERAELAYTDSVLSSITLAEKIGDLKEIQSELIELGLLRAPKERAGAKRKEVETPFREYLYRDFRILAGRNNLQNDRLVRSASPNDLWLHTQKYHSSHVIVVTDGRKVTVLKKFSEE
jgi:predicted ribosome quality control (RQC) complex YloA/Tae2 family protein